MIAPVPGARGAVRPMRRVAFVIASSVIALTIALPAQAGKPLEHERFTDTDSFIACGVYEVDSTFSGMFMVKDARPPTDGQFFEFLLNYEYRDVVTNPVTGDFFTVSGNGLFKELKPKHLEGTIFTWETIESGQPFVVRDMTGRVVLRDRGVIRIMWTGDLFGDSEPGADIFDGEVLRVSGPHPGFEETFDFCALADQLIG